MEKEEVIKKLDEADKIFVTLEDWGFSKAYNSEFPYFMLWVQKACGTLTPVIDETSPYWTERKHAYGMAVWGSERTFELLYSISGVGKDGLERANRWNAKLQRLWVG